MNRRSLRTLLYSLLINAAAMFANALIFMPNWETNDDLALLEIVCGAHGVYDYHLINESSILGRGLVFLYSHIPHIPWYTVAQYVFLFIAFTVVTYIILDNFEKSAAIPIIAGFLIIFSYECYVWLQFTKTAGVLMASGAFAILYAFRGETVRKGLLAAGGILAIAGCYYRLNQALCVGAFFGGAGIYVLVKIIKSRNRKVIRDLLIFAASFFVIMGASLAVEHFDYSSEKWQEYARFDDARTTIYDYYFPDYVTYHDMFESLEIDETAHALLGGWTFEDRDKFSVEAFETIASVAPEKVINRDFIKAFIKTVPKGLLKTGGFWFAMLLALLWFPKGKKDKWNILGVIYLILATGGIYFLLYFRGRYLINRVDVGIWAGISLVIIYMLGSKRFKLHWVTGAVIIALTLVILPNTVKIERSMRWRPGNNAEIQEMRVNARKVCEAVNGDQDHIYFLRTSGLPFGQAYNAFADMPFGIADNMFPLGSWTCRTPFKDSVLEKYGIENPIKDMIDDENAYIVDPEIDSTLAYIRRWYAPDAVAIPFDIHPGVPLYKIKSSG